MRYHNAVEELRCEGVIDWDKSVRYAKGKKRYIITERGLEMLREFG